MYLSSKFYVFALLSFIALGLAILGLTCIYIQPVQGDLTRMGAYAERDYGWNIPLDTVSGYDDSHHYQKYYDVVILGDSFSQTRLWQYHAFNSTNLTFVTLNWDNYSFGDVIESKQFRENPPKIFIVEYSVKSFPLRFLGEKTDCKSAENIFSGSWNIEKGNQSMNLFSRHRLTSTNLDNLNLKFALLYIYNSMLRNLFGVELTKVSSLSLSRNDLFSTKQSNKILILNSWLESKQWSNDELMNSVCKAVEIQDRVQSNSKTLMIFLPIIEKNIAYNRYIKDNTVINNAEVTIDIGRKKNLNVIDIRLLLERTISKGIKDVFLPNDTHLGNEGHKVIAQSIKDKLSETKLYVE